MKRILSFILIIGLFSISSLAEELELTNMTYEQLVELKQAVDNEYYARPEAEPRILYPGYYVIGNEIPAGQYYLTVAEFGDEPSSGFYVYESKEKKDNRNLSYWEHIKPGTISSFRLETGNIIAVEDLPLLLSLEPFEDEDLLVYTPPEGTPIPSGTYEIGVEIPSGTYQVYPAGISGSKIFLYNTVENYQNERYVNIHGDCDSTLKPYVTKTNNGLRLKVTDGNIVIIEGDVIMKKQSAFVFE